MRLIYVFVKCKDKLIRFYNEIFYWVKYIIFYIYLKIILILKQLKIENIKVNFC